MRVFVFSYVRLFSEAIAEYLSSLEGITESRACHGRAFLADDLVDSAPDIVLMDVTNRSALEDARVIRERLPAASIVGLAVEELADAVIACADHGFDAYVARDLPLNELKSALYRACNGECACHPRISSGLLREIRRRSSNLPEFNPRVKLSVRECEIVQLVVNGASNKEIARKLNLSVATVKNHLHSVFAKLQTKGRFETVQFFRNAPVSDYSSSGHP